VGFQPNFTGVIINISGCVTGMIHFAAKMAAISKNRKIFSGLYRSNY
jgi:hypothetical protein